MWQLVCGFDVDIIEGNLEVKLPTLWTDEAAELGRVINREENKKAAQIRERVRRKNMRVREQVERSRNTVCFVDK